MKSKDTNKLVLSSFFKIITIDGRAEQVTTSVRRTIFFDDEASFPFSRIKKVEVATEELDSAPSNYLRYLVVIHLTDGKKVVVDDVGESSGRGGLKEMKNLGKKISVITGKELKMCGE